MIVYFKCLGFFALWFTFFTYLFFIFFIEYSGKLGVTNMWANCILCHAMKDLWYDCLKSNPMSVLWCKNIRVSLMECVSVRACLSCSVYSYIGVQSESWLPKHVTISFSLTRSATQTVICMCCQHLQTVCLMWETTVSWNMNCMPMAAKHIILCWMNCLADFTCQWINCEQLVVQFVQDAGWWWWWVDA